MLYVDTPVINDSTTFDISLSFQSAATTCKAPFFFFVLFYALTFHRHSVDESASIECVFKYFNE